MFLRALAATVALLLAACGTAATDTPGGPCWDGEGGTPSGSIEIGTGTSEFIPLADGADALVEAGFQGNSHIAVNVRMTGLEPGNRDLPATQLPKTRITISREGGERIDAIPCPYSLAFEGEDPLVLPSGRLVVLRDDVIPTIDGARLTIEVKVIDNGGASASASLNVIAVVADSGTADAGIDGG